VSQTDEIVLGVSKVSSVELGHDREIAQGTLRLEIGGSTQSCIKESLADRERPILGRQVKKGSLSLRDVAGILRALP
jgi:hypothetical protein